MEKYYYHATPYKNLGSILINGIQTGADKLLYLCDAPSDAVKFVAIRGYDKVLVAEIPESKLDKKYFFESFDHSFEFFQCRAWAYSKTIESTSITEFTVFIKGQDFNIG